MTTENTDNANSLGNKAGDGTGQSSSPSDKEGGEELIFGKYKTMDDASKSFKELEREFHERSQKLSEMERSMAESRKEAELYKGQSDIKELLAEVIRAKSEKAEPAMDWSKLVEGLETKRREDPGASVKDELSLMSGWVQNAEKKALSALSGVEAKLRAEYDNRLAEFESKSIKASEEYKENKAAVDMLCAKGIRLSDAVEMAKSLNTAFSTQRIMPPTMPTGAANEAGSGKRASGYWSTPAERQLIVDAEGEEIAKAMESDYNRRMGK